MIPMTEKIYIFGAHTRAQNLYAYLKMLFPNLQVEAFLFDNEEPNPQQLYGISVLNLKEMKKVNESAQIWVAVKGIYFTEIAQKIKNRFSNQLVLVTPEIDNELRNLYTENIFKQKNMEFIKIYDIEKSAVKEQDKVPVIYMVKSIYDQSVLTRELPSYILPIQAGTELTDIRVAELSDNAGENISEKNQQYCEVTALYWMWKNIDLSWVGLCHYRRHFVLSEAEAINIPNLGVDVILPVPSICQPTVGENYRKRHDESDWEHLLELIHNKHPEMYDTAIDLWETMKYGSLYYTCNMFIMKKSVLDEYCAWLFPILEEMEKFGGVKQDKYQNRYVGFLAERLMSLYFIYYRNKYKIAYIDKEFIKD